MVTYGANKTFILMVGTLAVITSRSIHVDTSRRKLFNGNESNKGLNRLKLIFTLGKNGGYIHSGLGSSQSI